MGLVDALFYKPIRVLGFISGAHAFIYGIGFLLGLGRFTDTVLYLGMGSEAVIVPFGVALLISGGLLMFAYIRNNPKTIKHTSFLCGVTWLFASMSYLLGGAWLLSIGIGLPWAIISGYLAFAHGNRRDIITYDQTLQAITDTDNEDIL